MKIHYLGLLAGAAALASSFFSCTQPKIPCTVGRASNAPFIGVYTKTGGTCTAVSSCLIPGAEGCAADYVGLETFYDERTQGDEVQPDFEKQSLAVKTEGFQGLIDAWPDVDANEANKPYSIGLFDSAEPDDQDFCRASSLSVAKQELPEVLGVPDDPDDPMSPTTDYPATTVTYEWSDFRVYVTAAAQGTQFQGKLKYTEIVDGASCADEYDVIGVWPPVDCATYDADGNIVVDDMGNPVTFDAACCPDADPAGGRPFGSGLNPDFPVKCDPVLLTCVLDFSRAGKSEIPVVEVDWSKDEKIAPQCKPTAAE